MGFVNDSLILRQEDDEMIRLLGSPITQERRPMKWVLGTEIGSSLNLGSQFSKIRIINKITGKADR